MRAHTASARWLILVVMALTVLLLLWYFFRPERLFINKTVNEPAPQSMLLRPSRDVTASSLERDLRVGRRLLSDLDHPMVTSLVWGASPDT